MHYSFGTETNTNVYVHIWFINWSEGTHPKYKYVSRVGVQEISPIARVFTQGHMETLYRTPHTLLRYIEWYGTQRNWLTKVMHNRNYESSFRSFSMCFHFADKFDAMFDFPAVRFLDYAMHFTLLLLHLLFCVFFCNELVSLFLRCHTSGMTDERLITHGKYLFIGEYIYISVCWRTWWRWEGRFCASISTHSLHTGCTFTRNRARVVDGTNTFIQCLYRRFIRVYIYSNEKHLA